MTKLALALVMTEEEFTATVIELAQWRKWRVFHPRPARTRNGWRTLTQGDIGYPDLTLARGGVVLLCELKSQRGRLSADQKRWAEQIGPEHYRFWRPSDLDDIRRELL